MQCQTPLTPPAAPGTLDVPAVVFGGFFFGEGDINFNHTVTDYVFAPVVSGAATLNVLAGTTILTADNTYTGPTNVKAGALFVNGSIASSTHAHFRSDLQRARQH